MLKPKLYLVIMLLMMCTSLNCSDDFYSKFYQKDYKYEFQRVEIFDYDKSVLNFFELKTFKYNRTLPAINMTINSKINMSTDLEITIQAYKFLSNEYRMIPGFRFQINLCKSLRANIAGLQIVYKCGNFTSCQLIEEKTYKSCNIHLDESRFPPLIPSADYKMQGELIRKGKIFATCGLFVKIYRPIAIPGKH